MKNIVSLFKKNSSNKKEEKSNKVVEATNITLDRYKKTFKDLALYDKREKIAR